jgi:hypothetical protein
MIKLSELQEMWKEDAKIDMTNLGHEAAKVPTLHAKYLALLTSTKLKLRKLESDMYSLRRLRERYYKGELSKEELHELGWEQYLFNRPLNNQMQSVLDADSLVIEHIEKVEYYKTVVYQLEQIIKSINSRTWDIKSTIDWYKFTNGGL